MIYQQIADQKDSVELEAQGKKTAILSVTDIEKKRRGSAVYMGHVTFKTESGEIIETRIGIPDAIAEGAIDYSQVMVKYLPRHPKTAYVDYEHKQSSKIWFYLGALFFAFFAFYEYKNKDRG